MQDRTAKALRKAERLLGRDLFAKERGWILTDIRTEGALIDRRANEPRRQADRHADLRARIAGTGSVSP
jgi:hypothetical protein